MILIDFFLGMMALFVFLVVGMGFTLWLNIRRHLNPFLRAARMRQPPHESDKGGDVIEGEYRVLEEGEE